MKETAVKVSDLVVKMGEHTALYDINFEVPASSFLSIVGPNGAGKTTLLKTILGILKPTNGEVLVFGKPAHKLEPGRIGYISQTKQLDRKFPALSIELVITGLTRKWPWFINKKLEEKALNALNQIGASHLAYRSVGKLSGGELQKVLLARALIGNPELIVLDEPATGIDAVGEADMYLMLEKFQKEHGATILMITHDLNAVCNLCSHVLVLNQKQIGFGPNLEALNDENLRRAFGHIGHHHGMLSKVEPHKCEVCSHD